MLDADNAVVIALLIGLLMLAAGVLLFVSRMVGEYNLPLDAQLIIFGVLILLFGVGAGKILSGD